MKLNSRGFTESQHDHARKKHPRPIIAKVSFFKDKQQIKSHIKHLPRGKKFGVADGYPKEVDEIRRELYPVMKKAKRDHKTAFFNVEKLIIDKAVYRGPGRVNVVKTLEISKLTFICSVLDTPKGFTDEVNNIIFDYIRKYKNPKLKKNDYSQK